MFNIGDKVYRADYGRNEKWITCPDCLGSARVKVVLGDGTEVSIECGGCNPGGYNPSLGRIKQYEFSASARRYTVTGIRTSATNPTEYELDNFGGSSYTIGEEGALFATEAEAVAYGEARGKELQAEENRRLLMKTKDSKSWSWNYSYHMKCIKDLERQLEYHKQKAQVCKANARQASPKVAGV